MYKLIVFDLDGTLVDTLPSISMCFNETLTCFNIDTLPPNEVYAVTGLPLREMFNKLTRLDEQKLDLMVLKYKEIFAEKAQNYLRIFPGVQNTLEILREKAYISIATSRSLNSVNNILKLFRLTDTFSFVIANDSVLMKKPHPEMLYKTMNYFNLNPHEIIIVGDSIYDIQMGKAAGTYTCGVTYGANTPEQLREEHPDYIINALPEITDILI